MKRKKVLGLLICLSLAVALCAGGCARLRKPFSAARPGVSGFYVNEPGAFDSYPSMKAHTDLLDEIYPLWYHIRQDGTIQKEMVPQALATARKHGIKVIPLVNLVPSQDYVLLNSAARDRAISGLIQEVKKYNYDGLNIDFEFIPMSMHQDFTVDRDRLTVFIKQLHGQLRRLGKETHMSVLPHVGISLEIAGVYDYGALAPYVDKVTVMCYDHSQASSPPGPLAPFSWVEQNIKTAIKQGFRPSQICLGVATYGYDWPAGKSGGFSTPTRQILKQAALKGYRVQWSDKYQEPFYTYTGSDGITREVWFENEATLQTKLNLVKKYQLAGICIWRLGFEDARFWNRLEKNWGKRSSL